MLRLVRWVRDRVRADQRGSLALSMSVLMIVANLSTLVLARTMVALHQIRNSQDFAAGLSDADGALADALFQIDQNTPSTITGSGAISNRGAYTYSATKIDSDTYDVVAKGTINGAAHAIRATVARTEKFPYAVFANNGITLDGNGTGSIYSYATLGGPPTGHARIGSNGQITINSGQGGGDFQDYYAPSGKCAGCPNGVAKAGPFPLVDYQPPTIGTQPCPLNGTFSGGVSGGSGTPYVCDRDVTLSGNVNVNNGPLVIYITADHGLNMDGSDTNHNGVASDVQIYKLGSGPISLGDGSHAASFNGVLYAPESTLTINGGQSTFYGSIVLNQLVINGTPNFTFGYDDVLRSIVDKNWHVTHWREIPSSSANI